MDEELGNEVLSDQGVDVDDDTMFTLSQLEELMVASGTNVTLIEKKKRALSVESERHHESFMNLEDIHYGDRYFDEEGNLQTVEPEDELQRAIEAQLLAEDHHSTAADPAVIQIEEAEEHVNTAADAGILQPERSLEGTLSVESERYHESFMNLEDIHYGDRYFDEEGNLQSVEPEDELQGAIEAQLLAENHHSTAVEPAVIQTEEVEEHHNNAADPAVIQTEEAEEHVNTAADAGILQPERSLEGKPNEGGDTRRKAARDARLKGLEYIGFRRVDKTSTNKIEQDVPKEAKKMGDRCSPSQKCAKWFNRGCKKITDDERETIFKSFWADMSWDSKKMFICSLVEQKVLDPNLGGRKRNLTYLYHLKVGTERVPVCKKMFLNTFGLKEGSIRRWLENYFAHNNTAPPKKSSIDTAHDQDHSLLEENNTGEVSSRRPSQTRNERKRRITEAMRFIDSLPKLPSHYTRRDSKKMYFQGDIPSEAALYRLYQSQQASSGRSSMSRHKFHQLLKTMNVGIFKPRKDMCDFCTAYEKNNKTHEAYLKHVSLKDRARQEKDQDKLAAQRKECYAITVDLMNVQCLPFIRASSAYYKLKLAVHNYSIFNLEDNDVKNYWWDETVATLEASTYASCLVNYIEEIFAKEHRPKIIIWSDGCTSQNRNSIIANALLHLSSKLKTKIVQKYLEKGHTQMEVDSVHSHIERALKPQQVYSPTGFTTVTLAARNHSSRGPYRAVYLTPDFVKDYEKNNIYPSIRPGSQPGEPVVTDIRVLEYDGQAIRYKLHFDDQFQMIPRKRCAANITLDPNRPHTFTSKRTQRIKIPFDKWTDLQALKAYVPLDCQSFYDAIPFESQSRRKEKRVQKQKESGGKKLKK